MFILRAVEFESNGLKSRVNVTPVFASSMSGYLPTLDVCVADEHAALTMSTAAANDNHALRFTARSPLLLGPRRTGSHRSAARAEPEVHGVRPYPAPAVVAARRGGRRRLSSSPCVGALSWHGA